MVALVFSFNVADALSLELFHITYDITYIFYLLILFLVNFLFLREKKIATIFSGSAALAATCCLPSDVRSRGNSHRSGAGMRKLGALAQKRGFACAVKLFWNSSLHIMRAFGGISVAHCVAVHFA